VRDDIRAVVQAVRPLPVKVILECHYLSDEQILAGCDLAVEGGAAFVKTGTGWAQTGATLENVTLIKARLGGRAGIKAAGGVRGLETLLEMARRGVSRFGLGWRTATEILERVRSLPGGAVEL
jgi:deoxyribose-phosphate aldolase